MKIAGAVARLTVNADPQEFRRNDVHLTLHDAKVPSAIAMTDGTGDQAPGQRRTAHSARISDREANCSGVHTGKPSANFLVALNTESSA